MKKYRIKFKVEQIYFLDVNAENEDDAYNVALIERDEGNLDKELDHETYSLEEADEIKWLK